MKILPFKIPKTSEESFLLQIDHQPYFYENLHQHPEVQLSLILKGEGKLIAGDYVGPFKANDLFLFGSDLPHVFLSDSKYYMPGNSEHSHSVSVFFEWRFLGEKFLHLPEMQAILGFSGKTGNGLQVKGNARREVSALMLRLFETEKMERLLLLLEILDILSRSQETERLASEAVYHDFDEIDGKRLNDVYRFTMNEYHRKINLEEVAAVSNMTVNSFCRYFKKRTRKPYVKFLNEVRVAQACRFLQNKNYGISQIGLEVGFNNLSNFNRKFKEIKNCSPSEFRAKYERSPADDQGQE